jgi:multisubunit Na+/H+ antiporter MnhG subunit
MFYDPRISLGMLFTLIGTVLTAFGLATRSNPDVYAKSMGIDANLWWGLVLLVFGILVLTLGRRGQMKQEKIKK